MARPEEVSQGWAEGVRTGGGQGSPFHLRAWGLGREGALGGSSTIRAGAQAACCRALLFTADEEPDPSVGGSPAAAACARLVSAASR